MSAGRGRARAWPDTVLDAIRQFSETMGTRDRRERMQRLIEAVGDHYRQAGEPEPEWIAIARDVVAGKEALLPKDTETAGDAGVLAMMISTVPACATEEQHRDAVSRLLGFYERLYTDVGAAPAGWIRLGRERYPQS